MDYFFKQAFILLHHKLKALLLFIMLCGFVGCTQESQQKEIFYVGTFEGRGSEGIYVYEFDRETGVMEHIQTVSGRNSPNFQALHPQGHTLYSISNEVYAGSAGHGTITAYRIEPETGLLTLMNEQSVEGRGPAHVSVDPLGRFVYASNYSEGNLSVFRIDENGSLSEAVQVIQHEGSSINERRQNAPHVHSIIPSADGRFIYVSDLGLDKILIYQVNAATGQLTSAQPPYAENTPGSGPRHFALHPGGKFAYSAEELSSTVAVFEVNQQTGALEQIQRITMLPEGYDGSNSAADIHLSPDGKFLYASNRGHDSIVIYEVDEETGVLDVVGHEDTRGGHPRNFLMDQYGDFIFVANRDDDNVVIFERNRETGELEYTGEQIHVPMAVCLTQFTLK